MFVYLFISLPHPSNLNPLSFGPYSLHLTSVLCLQLQEWKYNLKQHSLHVGNEWGILVPAIATSGRVFFSSGVAFNVASFNWKKNENFWCRQIKLAPLFCFVFSAGGAKWPTLSPAGQAGHHKWTSRVSTTCWTLHHSVWFISVTTA